MRRFLLRAADARASLRHFRPWRGAHHPCRRRFFLSRIFFFSGVEVFNGSLSSKKTKTQSSLSHTFSLSLPLAPPSKKKNCLSPTGGPQRRLRARRSRGRRRERRSGLQARHVRRRRRGQGRVRALLRRRRVVQVLSAVSPGAEGPPRGAQARRLWSFAAEGGEGQQPVEGLHSSQIHLAAVHGFGRADPGSGIGRADPTVHLIGRERERGET